MHHPQTDQRLRVKTCEFHPTVREDTLDHVQNTTHTLDRAMEDFTVGDEHQVEEEQQDRPQVGMAVEQEEHQSEVEAVRRFQRRARPRKLFTYGTLGQPSYQQQNAGVNSLLPSYPLPSHLNTVTLPYLTHPHPHCYNCFSHAY